MTQHRSHLVTLPSLLANAAALHTIFVLFVYRQAPHADQTGMFLWWGCLTLTYTALVFFLRRPRSVRGIVVIAAGGLALQLALTLLLGVRYPSFLSWITLLAMWVGMYFRCCDQLLRPIKVEQLMTTFETTVLTTFIAALCVCVEVMAPATLLPLFLSILLSLAALARQRSSHPRAEAQGSGGIKSRLLLILILAVLGVCAILCVLLFTGSAASILTQITTWLRAAGLAFVGAIGRFFQWLFSLLPKQQTGAADLVVPESVQTAPSQEALTQNDLGLYVLIGIVLTALVLALFWLWRRGGRHHLPTLSRPGSHVIRRGRSLGELLAQVWHKFSRWIHFRYSYLTQRNTAPGLLIWLERQLHRRHRGRREGETCRAFLSRAQDTLPGCQQELTQLADCLDQHYFGDGQQLSSAQVIQLRRKFQKELHSHA